MISPLTDVHTWLWSDIEDRFTPLPPDSKNWTILHAAPLIAEMPIGFALSCIQAINKLLAYLASFSPWPRLEEPKKDFTSVLQDARQWKKLDPLEDQITLGKGNPNFLFGSATCTYQDSGSAHCPNSQWADWEKKILPEDNRSGKSADLFALYQTKVGRNQITDRLHQLGVNSYRFSIDWSQIQPEKGAWNEKALQVYIDLCKHLRSEGIEPMVTLHHFSEPRWFYEKGSFGNEENIEDFCLFAERVVEALTKTHFWNRQPLVEHFCTINEPGIEAFSRFVRGSFSPGNFLNFKKAAQFLKGALKAHCIAYERLKEKAPESVKIGIVHQYLRIASTNPLLYPITEYITRLVNDASLNFFRTGKFAFKMPFVYVGGEMPTPKTDFVGCQYYVRPVIGMLGPTGYHAPMTEMPFCEDPEGLYEAIIETHKAYKAPVIVTENGISTHDDSQRARTITRALYAAGRAQEVIGEKNLLGYYLWSFTDNFEWDMGMKPQAFGAFSLDGKLKKGAEAYVRYLTAWRKSWENHRDRLAS